MKKITTLIFTVLASLLIGNELSGVAYIKYATGDMNSTTDYNSHGFSLDRAYLTYKKDVAEGVSFQFQSDMQNKGEAFYMYIKNAKMDYNILIGSYADNTKFTIGLQGMNMFSTQEKTWGNRFLAKSAMDANGWSSSADLGIGVYQGFGDVSFSVLFTNGEGYKSKAADNHEKTSIQVVYGEKRLDKNDGFNVGGVYSTLVYDTPSGSESEMTGSVMGFFGGFSGSGARVGFDYNMGTDLDISEYGSSSSLMSFYGNYDLSFILDNMSVYIKYDRLDRGVGDDSSTAEADESTDDNASTMLAGMIFKCADGITFSPSMTQTTQGEADPVTGLDLNFQLKF